MKNLIFILPESLLLFFICFVLFIALFEKESISDHNIYTQKRIDIFTYRFSILLSFALFIFFILQSNQHPIRFFNGMFIMDRFSSFLKSISCLVIFFGFLYSKKYLIQENLFKTDFFILSLLSLLGQFILISSYNLLSLYLGLEMMALPIYGLIAMKRTCQWNLEAATKYFILNVLASGFLLYGISILYGICGSLDIHEIHNATSNYQINHFIYIFAIIFILSGISFKIGVVPYHMWVPDVYQGTSTIVTLFIACLSKLAAFALIYRLLINGLSQLSVEWQFMLSIISVSSLFVGNIAAIAQNNIKRMLAYSSIAHMGFMILGMLSPINSTVYTALLFYLITYILTMLGIFGLLIYLTSFGEKYETLDDLKGLHKKNPWMAFIGLILFLSLSGIPPTAGFIAKLFILETIVKINIYLSVISVLNFLIGAFYYLRVIKIMYFEYPLNNNKTKNEIHIVRILLSINTGFILFFGFFPSILIEFCFDTINTSLFN